LSNGWTYRKDGKYQSIPGVYFWRVAENLLYTFGEAWALRKARDFIQDGDPDPTPTVLGVLIECDIEEVLDFTNFNTRAILAEIAAALAKTHDNDLDQDTIRAYCEKYLLQELVQKGRSVKIAVADVRTPSACRKFYPYRHTTPAVIVRDQSVIKRKEIITDGHVFSR